MSEVLKASDTCLSTTHGELVIHKLPLSAVFLVLDEGKPWVSPFIEVEGQFYMPNDYSKTNPKIHDTSDTFYFPE